MTTQTTRQKLITYLADADDTKVNAIYTLLEEEIQKEADVVLTEEQYQILNHERKMHVSGQSKSYTRLEANQIIKGLRDL